MNIHWRVQWLELLGITKPNVIEKSKLYHFIHFFCDSKTEEFETFFFGTHDKRFYSWGKIFLVNKKKSETTSWAYCVKIKIILDTVLFIH